MGLITSLLEKFSSMKAKILLVGLDNAGKTTILYKMKLNEVVSSVPTVGFNVQSVKYKNLQFTVWDIGGQTKLRNLWHHYYDNVDAVIYVLDSSDMQRLELGKETLSGVMNHDNLKNTPCLVLANKMDMASLKPSQIVQKLGLYQSRSTWNLQPCCALNGQGIVEGFEWLRKNVSNKKK